MAKDKTQNYVLEIVLAGNVVLTTDPIEGEREAERIEDLYRQNLGQLVVAVHKSETSKNAR